MTAGSMTYGQITAEVTDIPVHFPARRSWRNLFAIALAMLALFVVSVGTVFVRGVGVWGNNIPVGWGFPISNYIWWIGLGHAGTLISAMLLLMAQDWRNTLNRFAEAMTLFAVICAGLYPIIHLGRPWRFYWMAPYPNTMNIWPQFKSPLTWDFFAVLTYLVVSLLFWYIGIIPDLAAARDRVKKRRWQLFFGVFALGWRGSAQHWMRWNQAYRITAAIAVPLVISVHSEISLLFAAGPVPGWVSTIFPPYFVLGAAFSGFGMVSILAIGLRRMFALENLVTDRHLNMLGLLLLVTGLMTSYGYLSELFTAAWAGSYEWQTALDRLHGPYAWSYWGAVILNFVPLQALWWKRVRTFPPALFAVSLAVVVGMWLERYMLLTSSLYRDWLESSEGLFHPTLWDWGVYIGTLGVFSTGFLLFIRFLPVISAFEVKEAQGESRG